MQKYKVTLYLMVDPTKGDNTFPKTYNVEAESESKAYTEAEKMQEKDTTDIARRSIFDFKVEEI